MRAYFFRYVHTASANKRTVTIHSVESLIPVFLAMDGIVSPMGGSERDQS